MPEWLFGTERNLQEYWQGRMAYPGPLPEVATPSFKDGWYEEERRSFGVPDGEGSET